MKKFRAPGSWTSLCPKTAACDLRLLSIVLILSFGCWTLPVAAMLECPRLPPNKQSICLKSPDELVTGIFLRDKVGARLDSSWPDHSLVYLARYSADCRLAEVLQDNGDSAWVSVRVINPSHACEGPSKQAAPLTQDPSDLIDPATADQAVTPPTPITIPADALPKDYFAHNPDYNFDEVMSSCSSESNCRSVLKTYATQGARIGTYDWSRSIMFEKVDGHADSSGRWVVISVYSQKVLPISRYDSPSATIINVEHTFPQSKLKAGRWFSRAKADLMHLFPTESSVNSIRGNEPFANCNGHGLSWVKCAAGFEPPHAHKGVVARAMFYMAISYDLSIAKVEEDILRAWAARYPVQVNEKLRVDRVFKLQGNRNPFVDHPEWIQLIKDF
jgi:deoxyribonuclease-1